MKKKTRIGQALIQGLSDVIDHEKGKKKLRASLIEIPDPAPSWSKTQIAAIRKQTFKLSQPFFAKLLNVKPSTVRSWEQGLKKPSGAASRLIQILVSHPGVLNEI